MVEMVSQEVKYIISTNQIILIQHLVVRHIKKCLQQQLQYLNKA